MRPENLQKQKSRTSSSHSASMMVLLKLSGMNQAEFAHKIGIHPQCVTRWKEAAPRYAVTWLQMYCDHRSNERELDRARALVGELCNMRARLKDVRGLLEETMEVIRRDIYDRRGRPKNLAKEGSEISQEPAPEVSEEYTTMSKPEVEL